MPIDTGFPPLLDVDDTPLPPNDCKKDPLCQEQAAACAASSTETACSTAGSACQWCASANQCWIAGEFCPSCESFFDRGTCGLQEGCTYCDRTPGPGCVNNSAAGSCSCWAIETEGACSGGCNWCAQASACIPEGEQCVSRRVTFVAGPIKIGTSNSFSTNPPTFKGLAGADAYCNHVAATSEALSGRVFKAWLSGSTASVQQRFTKYYVPYISTTGQVVAKGWGVIFSGGGLWELHKTVSGTTAPTTDLGCEATPYTTQRRVWTGTTEYGTAAGHHCLDWTWNANPIGNSAMVGSQTSTDPQWTNMCIDANGCGKNGLLYCFEQ